MAKQESKGTKTENNFICFPARAQAFKLVLGSPTVVGLAQSVERLNAEREVAGSNPGAGPLLKGWQEGKPR